MALSMFFSSVSGMEAQSHAMGTVSNNIANMRTVGYKGQDTMFYTLLGSQPIVKGGNFNSSGSRVDTHGVGYYDRTNISQQGVISSTGNNYDVAVNGTGNGFFVVKDASGEQYYTRAGDFTTRAENNVPYLISKNGMYVQGFQALGNGGFSSSLSDIKIDYPNTIPSVPTTQVGVTANVPAIGVDKSSYNITIYGPNNDGRAMNMLYTKVEGKANAWDLTFTIEDGTVASAPIEVLFDTNGKMLTPKTFDVAVNWNDGSTNNVHMDIGTMTQYDGTTGLTDVASDGRPSGNFIEGYIDNDGVVKAKYTNGHSVDYAKLAIVGFTAPENLDPISGTLFEYNKYAGEQYNLSDPNETNTSLVASKAVEMSTSTVEKDFANMVIIQRAYSMNANAFTKTNEMLEVAVNLKA